MSAMHKALVAAQKAFGPALKTNNNPAFKGTKYADLGSCIEAVLDALHANGFFLTHEVKDSEAGVVVECVLIHESGERHSSGPVYVPVNKSDAHGYGSALTYARRYSLMAACGIAPEDDDGNQATKAAPKSEVSKPVTVSEWEKLDTDTQDFLNQQAMHVKALLLHNVSDAIDEYNDIKKSLDAETQVAFWSLFDSKQRSSIKAEGAKKVTA
jgi:hypothetical protein